MKTPRLSLWLFLLAILLGLAGSLRAVEIVGGIQVDQPSPGTAVVRWQTDVECGARVRYGTSPAQLSGLAQGEVTRDHTVQLSGITAGQHYFLAVATAKKPLGNTDFIAQSSPASQPSSAPVTSPAATPKTPAPSKSSISRVFDTIFRSSASAPPATSAPPARQTWGHLDSLPDHFARHGGDFHARDAEDYAAQAWLFRQRAFAAGLPAKRDVDGSLRIFDPQTGAFAAYSRDGRTRTYFKPGSPGYFDRQPGTVLDLRTLGRP